jgi:hypothetical protein
MQQQQPVQRSYFPPVQQNVVRNPFELINEAFGVLAAKITELEENMDALYDRMNMVQGVQPLPRKRIQFTGQ